MHEARSELGKLVQVADIRNDGIRGQWYSSHLHALTKDDGTPDGAVRQELMLLDFENEELAVKAAKKLAPHAGGLYIEIEGTQISIMDFVDE